MPEPMKNSPFGPGDESYDGAAAKKLPVSDKGSIKIVLLHDHVVLRDGLESLLTRQKELDVYCHDSPSPQPTDTPFTWNFPDGFKPDILITDFAMEGLSPFELARRAKADIPGIQIIFLVSRCTDGNLERGLMAGASAFLSRNESIEGIITAIKQVQTGQKYFSDDIKKRLVSRHSYDPGQNSYTPRRALLSPREIEVLCCVAKGLKAKNIGKSLHITAKTVERHKSNIMAKLGLHSQVDLAIYAIKEGYVTL